MISSKRQRETPSGSPRGPEGTQSAPRRASQTQSNTRGQPSYVTHLIPTDQLLPMSSQVCLVHGADNMN